MARSAFEEYPRQTAVRLILLMGFAGAVLLAAGFFGRYTTFWAAGSILILFAVASWPPKTLAKNIEAASAKTTAGNPNPEHHEPSTTLHGGVNGDIPGENRAIFASPKVQMEYLRAKLARQREIIGSSDEEPCDTAS
ncbi:MAG: hypothetical protein JW719_11735 [Pirellulales bacterium]|nr:hypothetical protein [Pirellulales bacterium]